MNKDQFLKGLEAVDDELIAEAASTKSKGIKYKTKIRIMRFAMGAAVAAVMVTTGVLLHMNGKNAPEPEKLTGAAVATTSANDLLLTDSTDTTLSTAATTIRFDGKEFFQPMEGYSGQNDTDVVNVQYNIARNHGTWINCTKEQADTILEKLGELSGYDAEPALGIYEFTADVFIVNVEFYNGDHTQFTIPGGTIYESSKNEAKFTQFELKEGSTDALYKYLYDEYSKVQSCVEEKLSKTSDETTAVTDSKTVTTSIEYATLAKTTTRTGTAPVIDEPAVTTSPAPEQEREMIYNGDFFFPMKNYHYAGNENIVNVKFSNSQLLEAHNAWINCSPSQADRILNYISSFKPEVSEKYDITGGGFCVLVEYADGTSDRYEVLGTDNAYFILDSSNKRTTMYKDTSGLADELTLYLQKEYMKINDFIDSTFAPIYYN